MLDPLKVEHEHGGPANLNLNGEWQRRFHGILDCLFGADDLHASRGVATHDPEQVTDAILIRANDEGRVALAQESPGRGNTGKSESARYERVGQQVGIRLLNDPEK